MTLHRLVASIGLALVTFFAACSSGGDSARTVSKRGVVRGPITAFGSIFVGGIEFETTSSQFQIDDGTGSASHLAVGQQITIQGTHDKSGHGVAEDVRYDANLEGPVTAVDGAAQQFTAMGRTVQVDALTAYHGLGSLTDLAAGDFVEVSGITDADGVLHASYVERRSADAQAEARGTISALDTDAKTFQIEGLVVDYSAATLEPADLVLADGLFVEIRGAASGSSLAAAEVQAEDEMEFEVEAGEDLKLEGFVTTVTSDTEFVLNGQTVRHGAATTFDGGTAADIAPNVALEVEGTAATDGALEAKQIHFVTESEMPG